MFRHILVGLNGSEEANRALAEALWLAAASGGEVWALSVEERLPAYAASVGEVEEAQREREAYFQQVQAAALKQAAQAGVKLHTVTVAGHAVETIVRYVQEGGFDLIVLGASRRGTGTAVLAQAPCSVLVAREAPLSIWVEDIMTPEVVTVSPTTPLREVVEIILQRGINKAVPVIEGDRHVVGIITGSDLLERSGLYQRLSLVAAFDTQIIAGQLRELAQTDKLARDVMTAEVFTISRRAPVSAAVRLMAERRVKRLPVVDETQKLIGIVARLDVLRAIAHTAPGGELSAETAPGGTGGGPVRKFMATTPPTVTTDTPTLEVIARLAASPYRCVVVVDAQRKIVGTITDREVLQHIGPEGHASLLRRLTGRTGPLTGASLSGHAAEMMIRKFVVIGDDAPIMDALRLMVADKVKQLPVVNNSGKLVGMVDRDAVLRAIAGEL